MLAEMVSKLNLVCSMRMVTDFFFIKVLLMKFELTKRLFVLEIEQGMETSISDDITQSDLPWSFRFYDPVLKIVDAEISDESRQFFNLKAQMLVNQKQDRDHNSQLVLQKLGVFDSDKLKLKPTRLDDRDARLAGDVSDAMSLQRSNYVVIDPSKQVADTDAHRVMTPQHLVRSVE